MKLLYLDCFAGISGDMCLGALIDAGADAMLLENHLRGLPLSGWDIRVYRESSRGITGTRVEITVLEHHQPHRHYGDIRRLILDSSLPERVKDTSLNIFQKLAGAEGKVHGVPPDHVHFHEVGAVDSIVDIVGTALALDILKVESVMCSPVPTGRGHIHCQHGLLPVPAPATAELLRGIPLSSLDVEGELTTPTGAALASTLAGSFGTLPDMTVEAVGYGLGSKDFGIPNFLRAFLGTSATGGSFVESDTVLVIETNIDDMSPELLGHTMDVLFSAGALDVFFTPAQMKKNRPGALLTVLSRPSFRDAMLQVLFSETTTLGIRVREEKRVLLERSTAEVDTPHGIVRIKAAMDGSGRILKSAPEYEDCRRIALEKGIPARDVYQAALLASLQKNKDTL